MRLTGLVMKDLVHHGDRVVAVRGGKGGKGNVHFKNSVRQAPNFAEAGGAARERTVILELKLIADVGLLGFPNVGKSTFLSVSTSAKPKIGNYHFTTITPNLGVVRLYDSSFVMADIPGLVEGAHEGTGLGLDFLKHVERTKVLIHIVDIAGSEGRDPIEDFDKINDELVKYSERVSKKPQIVVGNKSDLIFDQKKADEFRKYVEGKGYPFFLMSAASSQGIKEVLAARSGRSVKSRTKKRRSNIWKMISMEKIRITERFTRMWMKKTVHMSSRANSSPKFLIPPISTIWNLCAICIAISKRKAQLMN